MMGATKSPRAIWCNLEKHQYPSRVPAAQGLRYRTATPSPSVNPASSQPIVAKRQSVAPSLRATIATTSTVAATNARADARSTHTLALPCIYELVATFLLTGGRESEVYGLDVADINFERRTVTFRTKNRQRRLKTKGSSRVVPLW